MENSQMAPNQFIPQTNQPRVIPVSQEPEASVREKNQKPPKILLCFLVAITLLALCAGGFWLYQKKTAKPSITPTSPTPIPTLSLPTSTPSPESTIPADWKTYSDQQIGYTINYPPEMIPSRGNCDSFILPASDEERKEVQGIRDSGIEIGYIIKGLELGFCTMSNPANLSAEDFAIKYNSNIGYTPVSLNGYEGVRGSLNSFVEYFIISPANKIVRLWFRYGQSKYQDIASQILSTFKFLDETDEMADWKTYKNEEYGFEFKYPTFFTYKTEVSDGDGLTIPYYQGVVYNNTNQIRFQVNKLLDKKQFSEENKRLELEGASLLMVDYKELTINSQKAISYQTKNNAGQIEANIIEIISRQSDRYIYIRYFGETKETLGQILSTFKFSN